jgi:hypothetical protein
MQLPHDVQEIINTELNKLNQQLDFDLHPLRRLEIYRALGPLSVCNREAWSDRIKEKHLPRLTTADRVRARIARSTAELVMPLWESACQETDSNSDEQEEGEQEEFEDTQKEEQEYLAQRREHPIEDISVYEVPRKFILSHIIEMADLAFQGKVQNYQKFTSQANEWWQIYPRPEWMEREFSIKWAAQEALYEAIGWKRHFEDITFAADIENTDIPPNIHTDGPAGFALLAVAGIFDEAEFRFDNRRRCEFWYWWLTEAIPQAWKDEH